MASQRAIKSLYYITHVDNLPSILERGILSHQRMIDENVPYTPIYDAQIVTRRQSRMTPDNKSLWEYANLFFQARNPMMYRVILESDKSQIAVLAVNRQVLRIPELFIATGNAASAESAILPFKDGCDSLDWKALNSEWWIPEDGSKRRIMAECLIPAVVPPHHIHTIYVANVQSADSIRKKVPPSVSVVPEPHMFFQPNRSYRVADNLTLIDGDMFFSKMQTLTISVNTVGVMGKGLASRAKYQFPDVYVMYEDLCKNKTLQMGQPYIYKRESSLDRELADEMISLPDPNANKWFLLFPTKKHWREKADLRGIEEGLIWFKSHYQHEGVKSLAVPALGCGLGGLEWHEVGPLMCRQLVDLDIEVAIYLPREKMPPDDQLTAQFLLERP
jgi:hypothetical protein